MDNFIKNSFGMCVNYLKTKYDNYKLIETQNKLIYFSAFSLNMPDFILIYKFIKRIKENLFKKLLDATKYTANHFVSFKLQPNQPNFPDKEKVLIIFSVCFLYYYSMFSFDQCPSFNMFFTQDFIALYNRFNITIVNLAEFKVYCYSFYYQLINELKQCNYNDIKEKYYLNTKKNTIEEIKGVVDKRIITPLVSAKERIVDMVYSLKDNIKHKGSIKASSDKMDTDQDNKGNLDKINNNLYQIYSNEEFSQFTNKAIINYSNEFNQCSINDDKDININSLNTNPNSNIIDNDYENIIYSKRLLCELVKCNMDPQTNEVIKQITENLDTRIFDEHLCMKTKNDIQLINPFICYIIELKALSLKNQFPQLPLDYIFRYILPSENIYLQAIEIYFAIHDLAFTDSNSFITLIQIKYQLIPNQKENTNFIKSLLYFFKMVTDQLISTTSNINNEEEMFNALFIKLLSDWKACIMQKCQELTHFRSV